MSSRTDVTRLLDAAAGGNRTAVDELFSVVYGELKRLAHNQTMQSPGNYTLQSTGLVHEVWLRLIGSDRTPGWESRNHFFAAAAQAMRQILVDAARARNAQKRGGANVKLELREDDLVTQQDEDLLALDEALELLRQHDESKARLVDLRYFAGMTNAQAAEQLGISTATAERHWVYARAWLRAKLENK